MNKLTEEVFARLKTMENAGKFAFPPPCAEFMEANFESYEPGTSMTVSFPVKEAYNNPFGITNGGFYGVFFDLTFGPFSSLEANGPSSSLDLNITFLKPLSPADGRVWVEAKVISRTKSYMVMHGSAFGKDSRLLATATTRMFLPRNTTQKS